MRHPSGPGPGGALVLPAQLPAQLLPLFRRQLSDGFMRPAGLALGLQGMAQIGSALFAQS